MKSLIRIRLKAAISRMMDQEVQQLHLSSLYATLLNGTGSVAFSLAQPVQNPVRSTSLIALSNAQIPRSWTVVNATNATLTGSLTPGGAFQWEMTHGNYTPSQLATHITTLSGGTATVSYNSITNYFTITPTTATSITLNETALLGFSTATTGNPIVSDATADLLGFRSVRICTNLPTQARDTRIGGGTSNVLERVPVNQPPQGLISYTPVPPHWARVFDLKIDELRIDLIDESGNIIDMRGAHWEITLLVRSEGATWEPGVSLTESLQGPPVASWEDVSGQGAVKAEEDQT